MVCEAGPNHTEASQANFNGTGSEYQYSYNILSMNIHASFIPPSDAKIFPLVSIPEGIQP